MHGKPVCIHIDPVLLTELCISEIQISWFPAVHDIFLPELFDGNPILEKFPMDILVVRYYLLRSQNFSGKKPFMESLAGQSGYV